MLQAYDEEVTIRRTLLRTSGSSGFQSPSENETAEQPSFVVRFSETSSLRRRVWLRRGRRRRSGRRLIRRTCWRRNRRRLRLSRGGRSCWSSLLFHQLTPERAVPTGTPMRIQNRQPECEREENGSQPSRELHKNVRRLRAENVFRDRASKCRPQTFALWTLHQDNKHHEQRHQHEDSQKQIDEKVHRGGKYR